MRPPRLFVSHCINSSDQRPLEFRDSQRESEKLNLFTQELAKRGFRLFEYGSRQGTEESDYRNVKERNLLRMMFRQLEMADGFVLVTARAKYAAPGWMIPELFHARALGLPVFHCCLLDDVVRSLGDACDPERFQALLEGVQPHSPENCLAEIEAWRERQAVPTELDALGHFDRIVRWAADPVGKISERFAEWIEAEAAGFRAACDVFPRVWRPEGGLRIFRLGIWIGTDGLLVELLSDSASAEPKYVHYRAGTGSVEGPYDVPGDKTDRVLSAGTDGTGGFMFLLGRPDGPQRVWGIGTDRNAYSFPVPTIPFSVTYSDIRNGYCWVGRRLFRIDTLQQQADEAPATEFAGAEPFVWLTLDPQATEDTSLQLVDLAKTTPRVARGRPWTILPSGLGVVIGPGPPDDGGIAVVAVACDELRAGRTDHIAELAAKLRKYARTQKDATAEECRLPQEDSNAILRLSKSVFHFSAGTEPRQCTYCDTEDLFSIAVWVQDGQGGENCGRVDVPVEWAKRLLRSAIGREPAPT